MNPKNERIQNVWRLAGTLLALILLAILIREESGAEIISALKSIQPLYFILGIFVMLVSRMFVILRWHILLRSAQVEIPFLRTAMLTFTGLFSSNFLPTTIGGDVVRLTGAMQLGYDRAVCLASLVADRLIGMAGMLFALPFGLIPVFSNPNSLQALTIAPLIEKIRAFIQRTLNAFSIWLKKPKALISSLFFTFVNMACIFAAIYLLAEGMSDHLSYWLIAGLWSLTYFVTLIPISINGFGVQELSLTFLLSNIGGLSNAESLTIAILIRILFIITSLPGAFFLPSILAAMNNKQEPPA
ncbi:MAG: flippase-like domain-containing protein [Anaerolineales bacterium]|nr:flippase-like domain-containing protein [Anaerolineales bacterium]MBX3036800.1 flippase-like domain-containing protein [Anaerolineales bacterium]